MTRPPAYTIGVSLKMYFNHHQTLRWLSEISQIALDHQAIRTGIAELFVLPSFPSLVQAGKILAGTSVRYGAQNLAIDDSGPFTGEVSGRELAEIGCSVAEIGHAERRNLFHENDEVIAAKTVAAVRNGLIPLLCVGEEEQAPPAVAALEVTTQLDRSLAALSRLAISSPIWVAYEPQWAIGAPQPASTSHIRSVIRALEQHLSAFPDRQGSRVIYGGSAGPGLLSDLDGDVHGLFLGRRAHNANAVKEILDEVLDVTPSFVKARPAR